MTVPWPVTFRFLVDQVHDGDTILGTVQADAGLGIAVSLSGWAVSLYGITAPGLDDPNQQRKYEALNARDYLRGLVSPTDWLSVRSYSFDKYGRRIDGKPVTQSGVDLCVSMLSQPGVMRAE